MFTNPPITNGIMELTEVEKEEIRGKLIVIQENFVPTPEQPVCDTFYLVSTYNRENELKINGDTSEFILSEPTEDSEEVGEE